MHGAACIKLRNILWHTSIFYVIHNVLVQPIDKITHMQRDILMIDEIQTKTKCTGARNQEIKCAILKQLDNSYMSIRLEIIE